VSPVRIALLAAVAAAVIAGALIARSSGDGEDGRPARQSVSAAEVERNLEHEYRCELGAPRAVATCRPKGRMRFDCEIDERKPDGTSRVELEIDGANYDPVAAC
jgi:hypothetical protein